MEEREREREKEVSWVRHGMKSAMGSDADGYGEPRASRNAYACAHARVQWMGWREKELFGEFMQPQTHQST